MLSVYSFEEIIQYFLPVFSTTVRMATTIAKAVVGSKVKSITKDIEGAVGLGDDKEKESEAVAEFERMKVDEEFRKKQQQRKKERELIHAEKEIERQRIRDKYKLPNRSKKSKGRAHTSSQGAKNESQVRPPQNASGKSNEEEESKCLIS